MPIKASSSFKETSASLIFEAKKGKIIQKSIGFTRLFTQFRDPVVRPAAPRGAFRLRGKEVVFSQGAGFEAKVFSWSFGNKTTDVIRSNCRSSSVRPNKEKVGKGRRLTK